MPNATLPVINKKTANFFKQSIGPINNINNIVDEHSKT